MGFIDTVFDIVVDSNIYRHLRISSLCISFVLKFKFIYIRTFLIIVVAELVVTKFRYINIATSLIKSLSILLDVLLKCIYINIFFSLFVATNVYI